MFRLLANLIQITTEILHWVLSLEDLDKLDNIKAVEVIKDKIKI